MISARGPLLAAVALMLFGGTANAQGRSQIVNGSVETRTATAPLAMELERAGGSQRSVWVGYRVATIPMRQDWCSGSARTTRVLLEPSRATTVLARLEAGALTQVRTVGDGCEIDAGGLPMVWLDNVSTDASLTWLTSLVRREGAAREQRKIAEQALATLAWHDGAAATTTLVDVARNDRRAETRSRAIFWLSQRAGQAATAAISGAIDNDPDTAVRKKAVFALSQLPSDQGVPLLIQVARTHPSAEVRKQAMFWLGQSKDQRALEFFEDVLRR